MSNENNTGLKSPKGLEQLRIINTTPIMTETERETAKKKAGKDLYEVFLRIRDTLKI